jgi:hypothetical protein
MLAPLGATVAVVLFVVVFPALASDVLVSLVPMLAPLGATVAVVLFVVVVAFASTAGLPVVAFCGKQADCMAAVVVTFVSLAAGPNDAPPGAGVAAVSLPPAPPVACTGLTGATAMNVSISKIVGKAIVVMNLRQILDLIAVLLLTESLLLFSQWQ